MSRVFAILQLTQMHENFTVKSRSTDMELEACLSQEIASGLILMLLNDESSVIRHHAISFTQAYDTALQNPKSDSNSIICFSANKKIVSQAKRSADDFTPPQKQVTLSLLKTLLKVRMELAQDRNQLATTMSKVKN